MSIPTLGPSRDLTGQVLLSSIGPRRTRAVPIGTPLALRLERAGADLLVVPLYPDRTYVFGRAADASFVFPADVVSRLHAQLRFSDGQWAVRDLNSSNGTFSLVDGIPAAGDPREAAPLVGVDEEHTVRVGETLLLGNGKNRVTFLGELPSELAGTPVGASPATQALERSVAIAAHHHLPVVLHGPSGAGKTFVARTIHERSKLGGLFVLVNCGRLPHDPAQLTSELLGHVRGAFTGAITDRKGKLWSADQGTLFLDEVESMPAAAQDFLLDVLEGTGSFAPFGTSGESRVPPPRFRLISASKRPLARSGLRPDLCQRLAAGDLIALPTLAERRDDIPRLIDVFLARLRDEQRIDARLTPDAVRFLADAPWPGEIRELESTVKVVVSHERAGRELDGLSAQRLVLGLETFRAYLEQRALGFGGVAEPTRKRPGDITRTDLELALRAHGGNKTHAAAALGIAVNTLKARLRGGEDES